MYAVPVTSASLPRLDFVTEPKRGPEDYVCLKSRALTLSDGRCPNAGYGGAGPRRQQESCSFANSAPLRPLP